jgi:Lipocalin-like domain
MSARSELVGRWDIVSWVQAYDDGRLRYPLGEDLDGFIRYTADGEMMCMIARRDRPAFTTGGQWDASDAERAAAYQSMLSYAGRYELADDVVIHDVELSLFPNWIGGQQRRRFVFRGDGTLALEARLEADTPQARTARLVWRRHGAAGGEQS